MKKLKIGNIEIENPMFLAPMVEVTDCAYREICREAGAGLAYIEMLYVDAILHDNKKTLNLLKTYKDENPKTIQITGSDIKEFEKLVKTKKLDKFDIIDLNCGCPSHKIVGNQAGSYLLNDPEKIAKIVKTLKKTGKIVTVKIRLGFKENKGLEIAKIIEKAGADALTVHARLASHSNSTPAQWDEIKKIKESLKIPVIGNGDIFSGKDASKLLEFCDGIMIARGAIGNPLIFKKINYFLKNKKELEILPRENIKLFIKYLDLAKKYDIIDLGRIKYLGSNFFKSYPGSSKHRAKLMSLKTYEEIKSFTKEIYSSVDFSGT